MLQSHPTQKLGRRPARHDRRTLMLSRYLTPGDAAQLPPVASSVRWTAAVDTWPMHLNDQIGCCTIASAAHLVQAWRANAKHEDHRMSDDSVLHAYRHVSGYTDGDPSTDTGAVALDVLKHWRKTGIGGHRVGAFVGVSTQSRTMVMEAVHLFGGLYAGLSLPMSAQEQRVWDVMPGSTRWTAPGSWGGHAVAVLDYDWRGLTCITWGALKRMTWSFFKLYCEEAYALLSNDFIEAAHAPNGFDVATLRRDLTLLAA